MYMEILTNEFYKKIEKELGELLASFDENEIENNILEITQDFVKLTKETLLSNSPKMLDARRKLFTEFCQRNYKRWDTAFDLFETFIVICTEAGEEFNKSYRKKAVEENNLVFDVLVRHHARACLICQEILCLLKSGFADGAHARWRSLHEVAATAIFIAKYGQECAERFYLHDRVESYDGMKQHKKYEHRLNEKGNTQEELDECEKSYSQLIKKYGKSFGKPYGWASHVIKKDRVTFTDIEKDVELDHMRPYYKWASQNVHAGTKGLFKQLGMCEAKEACLLVGQSNSGITDPAHASALSLAQITATLLNIEPNVSRFVIMNIISGIEQEIGQVFLQCDSKKSLS